MEAIPFVSAIFSVIGGAKSKSGYDDAARQERADAEANVQNINAEAARQEEVSREQHEELQAGNRAKAAASNLTVGGSQQIFAAAQKDKFNKEVEWLAKSAASRADIARQGGSAASTIAKNKGDQALWGGISNAVGSFN